MEIMRDIQNKLNIETVKNELLRITYGNEGSIIANRDARILIAWYLPFAIVPWFFHDAALLMVMFIYMVAIVSFAKVNRLIMALLIFGVGSQLFWYGVMAVMFGGNLQTYIALMVLTVKLSIISLSSVAVFTNMDPEKLGDGLMAFGCPERVIFGISYGYRMLPLLIEEYNMIFHTYRLRGKFFEPRRFKRISKLFYYLKLMTMAFYPLIFNAAKRTRITVEAIELRGFSYALLNRESKKLRLAHMKITWADWAFLATGMLVLVSVTVLGIHKGGL